MLRAAEHFRSDCDGGVLMGALEGIDGLIVCPGALAGGNLRVKWRDWLLISRWLNRLLDCGA